MRVRNLCLAASITGVLLAVGCATTASADVGFRDFSYRDAGRVETPTADKPQSKLWFHDGTWWGLLYSTLAHATRIHRLDPATQTWVDAGTGVDSRPTARADVLSDGDTLYVVSGTTVVSEWGNPPADADVAAGSAELSRYRYDAAAKTYRLDPGFPVTVHEGSTESITLAKDSTGTLWVTYTQHDQVWVNRTVGSDTEWGEPFVLPDAGANVHYDDISTVTTLDGAVGVMWSNQITRRFYFAMHHDGDPATAWTTEVAYGGGVGGCIAGCANDHLDVRSVRSDGSDRVFAAVKTANRNTGQPFIVLLVRDRRGNWTNTVFGTVEELHTRPMVAIDEEHRRLFLFAVAPEIGGAIYYKETSLDAPSFDPGPGTAFIEGAEDADISNPTTTRQPVNSASGLVVLASANSNARYWHNTLDLSQLPAVPPVAPGELGVSLPATHPESRLKLQWADRSVNESGFEIERRAPGGAFRRIATVGADRVSYTDSGLAQDTSYTYRLRAIGTAGPSDYSADAAASTAFVRTFAPRADATVDASAPRANFGAAPTLDVTGGPSFRQGDLAFELTGLGGATVRNAKLRLYVTDGGAQGGGVTETSPADWDENAITWATRPALVGTTLASLAAVDTGGWYQLDVSSAVRGDGGLGLRVRANGSTDEVRYASREDGAHSPELAVTLVR
jgi:hypothetical protein